MVAYSLEGNFFEACDCEVICSCWAEVEPVMGQCTGLFVWKIKKGKVTLASGLIEDVSGCSLATIAHGPSCDDADQMLVIVMADTAAQRVALKAAFSDKTGPWYAVFDFSRNQALQFQEGTIALTPDGKNYAASISSRDGAQTVFSVTANSAFENNFKLSGSSTTGNTLLERVVGSAQKDIEVGRITLPSADKIGGSGLDILADVYNNCDFAQPPADKHADYRFDLDVTSVTAMRGKFKYAHP